MKRHICSRCNNVMVLEEAGTYYTRLRCSSGWCNQVKVLRVDDEYLKAVANVKQLHVALVGIVL